MSPAAILNLHDYAVRISSKSGQELRFSSTANDPDELVTVGPFTTATGTGFESLVLEFSRDRSTRYDDLDFLDEVVLEGPDGQVLFEGAITGRAPEAGRGLQINCTGHWSQFKDKTGAVSEIIIDRETTRWGGYSPARQSALLSVGAVGADGQQEGAAALKLELAKAPWTNPGMPVTGLTYTPPAGAKIGRIRGQVDTTQVPYWMNANFTLAVALNDSDGFTSGGESTGDVAASGSPYVINLAAAAGGRNHALIEFGFLDAYTTPDSVERAVRVTKLGVEGIHGIDATVITGDKVLKFLVDTYCPDIEYDNESIAAHPYVIGQLVFDNTDMAFCIGQVNGFANWNPAVWEGKRLWWQAAPLLTQERYVLDQDRGDVRDKDEQSISEDYPVNGVQVNFTDALTGKPSRLLPADDYRLRSDDVDNPCNKSGRPRWGKLDISFNCTVADAIQIGSVWLAEHLIPSRAGTAKVQGTVITASGQEIPAQNMRADQVVRFCDESVGRMISRTSYDPASATNTLTFSDGAATLDALLQRIGVKVSLISGGSS